MDVTEKGFLIDTAQRDAKGNQIDAEEKRTEQVLETKIPVTLGKKDEEVGGVVPIDKSVSDFTGGKMSGLAIPQTVNVVGTAIEFATKTRTRCSLCLNFDNVGFLQWKKRMEEGSKEEWEEVNKIRYQVMDREPEIGEDGLTLGERHIGKDGDFDVEHALNECGVCPALREATGEVCVVWPESGCPNHTDDELLPIEQRQDYSRLFKPRDAEAEKSGIEAYDKILKTAAGTPVRKAQKFRFPKR
jgi:hypothetical protein